MKHFSLNGQARQAANKAAIKALRAEGLVPCNLYGQGVENTLFAVSAKDLKNLTHTPNSYIVDLTIDGKTQTAVLHELQFHPVTDECLHVDFLVVNEGKPVAINVPITISGNSPGVMAGGKFSQVTRSLKVSALMENLPDSVDVNISNLGLDKQISAGDLKYDNLTILTDKNAIVCRVKSTRQMLAAARG